MDQGDPRPAVRWRENLSPSTSWPDLLILSVAMTAAISALTALATGRIQSLNTPLVALRLVSWAQALTLALAFGTLSWLFGKPEDPGRSWARGWWVFTLQGSLYVLVEAGVLGISGAAHQRVRGALSAVNDGFFLYSGLLCLDPPRRETWRALCFAVTLAVVVLGVLLNATTTVVGAPTHRLPDVLFSTLTLVALTVGHLRAVGRDLPDSPAMARPIRVIRWSVCAYLAAVYLAYAAVQLLLPGADRTPIPLMAVLSSIMLLLFATGFPSLQMVGVIARKLSRERERAEEERQKAEEERRRSEAADERSTYAERRLRMFELEMSEGSIATFEEAEDGKPLSSSDVEVRLLGYKAQDEILALPTRDVLDEDPEAARQFRVRVLRDGRAHRRATMRRPDLNRVVVDVTAIRVADTPMRIRGLLFDATAEDENERLESALRALSVGVLSDPDSALYEFLRMLKDALNADAVMYFARDTTRGFLITRAFIGDTFRMIHAHAFPLKALLSIAPTASAPAHAGQCPYCDDPRWRKALHEGAPAASNCVMLPLPCRDGLRGAIWLRFHHPSPFDSDRRQRLERFAEPAGALLERLVTFDVDDLVRSLIRFDPKAPTADLDATLTDLLKQIMARVKAHYGALLVREPDARLGHVRLAAAFTPGRPPALEDFELTRQWKRIVGSGPPDLVEAHDRDEVDRLLTFFFRGEVHWDDTLLARRVGLGDTVRAVILLGGRHDAQSQLVPFCDDDAVVVQQYASLCALMLATVDLNVMVLNRWRYTAHELSSPLVAVLGEAERALRQLKRGNVTRVEGHLEAIEQCAQMQKHLIDTMEVADANTVPSLTRLPTRMGRDVIGPVRNELQLYFKARGFSLDDVRIDPRVEHLPRLNVDAERLRAVFFNLLKNAAKYGHVAGQLRRPIEVTGQQLPDGSVEFIVRDHGIGIPSGWEAKVWQTGNRASNAIALGVGGYGIGLSVVRQVMEAHGGLADIKHAGVPTEIRITFPPSVVLTD